MTSMNEYVLVFKRDRVSLPCTGQFFTDTGILDEILNSVEFARRGEVEEQPSMLQIIPYSLLRYEERVLTYRRTGAGDEDRLHNRQSLGVGGHVNRSDFKSEDCLVMAAIETARDREIREEFQVDLSSARPFVGMIYDDGSAVGRVHFGLVFECWLKTPEVSVRESVLHREPTLMTVPEILNLIGEYESWSRIIIDNYLT